MSGKMKILLRGNRKIRLIFNIIFIFLIVNITLVFPSTPSPSTSSGTIVSVSTGDSGDFICDGSDDQVEDRRQQQVRNSPAHGIDRAHPADENGPHELRHQVADDAHEQSSGPDGSRQRQ